MKKCPRNGFQDCIEHSCAFYIQFMGKHPQTGVMQNEWTCAEAWKPVIAVEANMFLKQIDAELSAFKNVVAVLPKSPVFLQLMQTMLTMLDGRPGFRMLLTEEKKELDGTGQDKARQNLLVDKSTD